MWAACRVELCSTRWRTTIGPAQVQPRLLWEKILADDPDIERRIERLPNRVKVARLGDPKILIFLRKARGFYAAEVNPGKAPEEKGGVRYLSFPEALPLAEAAPETRRLKPGDAFWEHYTHVLHQIERAVPEPLPSNSLERRALMNLKTLLHQHQNALSDANVHLVQQIIKDLEGPRRLPRYAFRKLQALDVRAEADSPQALQNNLVTLERIGQDYGTLLGEAPSPELPEVVVGIEFRDPGAGGVSEREA